VRSGSDARTHQFASLFQFQRMQLLGRTPSDDPPSAASTSHTLGQPPLLQPPPPRLLPALAVGAQAFRRPRSLLLRVALPHLLQYQPTASAARGSHLPLTLNLVAVIARCVTALPGSPQVPTPQPPRSLADGTPPPLPKPLPLLGTHTSPGHAAHAVATPARCRDRSLPTAFVNHQP
jgi:hypothetical protein